MMAPRWTKLLRDVRAARGRFLTATLAMAASLCAVATMFTAWAILQREVPRNYLGSQPAAAQIEASGLDHVALQAVRQQPGIADAELGASVLARVQVGRDEWLPLLLFVVPDFPAQRLSRVSVEAGAWPPPDGGLVIERSALPLTRQRLGAELTVQLAQGRHALPITTVVHDPALAPAWQEQTVYGYATPRTLAALGETMPLTLLKLAVPPAQARDAEAIERIAREAAARLQSLGHAVHEIRVPPPARHPHQAQMNGVMRMLLVFSLLALALGGVLTGSVIGGLLAQHGRQIAIMKAIGARSRQVAAMYLVLAGSIGLVAVAVGLPLGLAAGRAYARAVGGLLNLRLQSLAVPHELHALVLLLGVGAPLVAAALPIAMAARRSVRQALDDAGVSAGAYTRSRWLRLLARAPLPWPALALALRNSLRRRARLALTVTLLAAAGAMFITSLDLRAAWEANVAQAAAARHYAIELRLQQPLAPQPLLARLATLPGVRGVESWPSVAATADHGDAFALSHTYPDGGHGGFALRAASPDTAMIEHSTIQGRWLRPGDADAVVLNALAHSVAFPQARPGDWIAVQVGPRRARLRVVGIVRELLTPSTLYVTPEAFARASGLDGRSNAFRIALRPGLDAEGAAPAIIRAIEAEGGAVRLLLTEKRLAAAQGGHVYILVFALLFIALLMAAVGSLGLASALGASVVERTREFGVLRAIGARSRDVLATVLIEGLAAALLSAALAVPLSMLLSARVGQVLASISAQPLWPALTVPSVLAWLTVAVTGAALASVVPALRAAQLTVRQTLAVL